MPRVDNYRVGNGIQREDKKLLQRSQLRQHGEFRHARAVLATNFEESDTAMAADGTTKTLVSPPPRRVSAPKLYGEDSA